MALQQGRLSIQPQQSSCCRCLSQARADLSLGQLHTSVPSQPTTRSGRVLVEAGLLSKAEAQRSIYYDLFGLVTKGASRGGLGARRGSGKGVQN